MKPGFWAGWTAAIAFSCGMVDRHGSLEAYIAHLQEASPWVWIQVPVALWVLVALAAFVVGARSR